MVDTVFRFFNFLVGLGRSCGLGLKLLSHRVVGGYVVPTAFFVRRYASEKKMAYLVAADAHVSQGLVVPRGRGPGLVRAVRVVGYGRASERVRESFDLLHSRLSHTNLGVGGTGSTVRLGLLSAGARASVERVSASTRGAIRAFSLTNVTTSKGAETCSKCCRDGVHRGSGHCSRVAHDDISARFRQIGSFERNVAGARVSGGQSFAARRCG